MNALNRTHLVSIGMPLHNEGAYLDEALEALLAQDYKNFEILICDNASTDETQVISQTWADRDSRIKYYRNETDIGAANNFSRAFELAQGDFFMWAAGHDLWSPQFISRCMDVLLSDEDIVLCCPLLQWISHDGERLAVENVHIDFRGRGAVQRYMRAIWRLQGNAVYGLIRKSVLGQTRLMRQTLGSDQVLLVELSLLGTFAQVKEPLFFRRKNRPDETQKQATERRAVELWEDGKRKKDRRMLYWQFVREIFGGINHVTAGVQKAKIMSVALPLTPLRYHRILLKDLVRLIA